MLALIFVSDIPLNLTSFLIAAEMKITKPEQIPRSGAAVETWWSNMTAQCFVCEVNSVDHRRMRMWFVSLSALVCGHIAT